MNVSVTWPLRMTAGTLGEKVSQVDILQSGTNPFELAHQIGPYRPRYPIGGCVTYEFCLSACVQTCMLDQRLGAIVALAMSPAAYEVR